jgi:hypothetical protein
MKTQSHIVDNVWRATDKSGKPVWHVWAGRTVPGNTPDKQLKYECLVSGKTRLSALLRAAEHLEREARELRMQAMDAMFYQQLDTVLSEDEVRVFNGNVSIR